MKIIFMVMLIISYLVFISLNLFAGAPGIPNELKTEYCVNPLGIDTNSPRFNWICNDSDRGEIQTSYQVIVASSQANIDSNFGDKWDSGRVYSSVQNGVKYAGSSLTRRTGYWWKVRVWDKDGNVSSYSSSAYFETGMLSQSDWSSQWIGGDYNLLRDDLVLSAGKTVAKARLYVTSLGYNEVYINGQKVGINVNTPAYTRYERRALYCTYDITGMLNSQNNGIGIMLGSAYYKRAVSSNLAARMEIHITYTDGSTGFLGTSTGSFKALNGGPIIYNDIWNGERYDARLEASIAGWANYGFNDSGWQTPMAISYSGTISAQLQAVQVTEEIIPVSITAVKGSGPDGYVWCANENDSVNFTQQVDVAYGANGSYVYKYNVTGTITFNNAAFGDPISGVAKNGYYKIANTSGFTTYNVDMGVNMVGWLRISVSGAAGTRVTLRFAENLRSDGSIETTDLRTAEQTDYYILKGSGTEVWEPRFTHHGFRYVEVTGFPGTPTTGNLMGRVIHTNYSMESSFTSSNSLINNIYKMYRRSQRSNTVNIPTDCPQRDERQGWGADAVVTSEAACYSFDMVNFYEKWFNDIDDCQGSNGGIPDTVPDYFWGSQTDTAWMSIRVLIPWDLYLATGDKDFLEKHYGKMKAFISYLQGVAGSDYLGTPANYGDWVPAGTTEGKQYFADAYFYQNVKVMAKIAGVLGNSTDQNTYNTLANNIQTAFNNSYFHSTYYGGNNQSANAIALYFDLVPAASRSDVLNSLLSNIQSNSNHLTTGILGSKAIMEALWKDNRSDVAYTLMTQTTYPSWGYMYNKGPGTIWERWNSDSQIGSGMNSYNHVMYGGGPATWVYKGLAGISALKPGYEEIMIKPEIVGDVTNVSGSVMTPKGMVISSWTKAGSTQVNLSVTIPANSKAVVYVPTLGSTNARIRVDGVEIFNGRVTGSVNGIYGLNKTSVNYIAWNVGSGNYSFVMTLDGSSFAGAPQGYTLCANEGETVNFSTPTDVAYGANNSFNYLNNVSGPIVFDNATFGDPIYGTAKLGYSKDSPTTPTPSPTTWLPGDANNDGRIDIVDALYIAQYYVGFDPAGFIPENADVDCSGGIDIVDALLVAQYYVGLITGFC